MAPSVVAFGLKVPEPSLVQMAVPAAALISPFKTISAFVAQTVLSGPASTVGASVIVTIIVSLAVVQPAPPVAVKIKLTVPEVVSASDGLY